MFFSTNKIPLLKYRSILIIFLLSTYSKRGRSQERSKDSKRRRIISSSRSNSPEPTRSLKKEPTDHDETEKAANNDLSFDGGDSQYSSQMVSSDKDVGDEIKSNDSNGEVNDVVNLWTRPRKYPTTVYQLNERTFAGVKDVPIKKSKTNPVPYSMNVVEFKSLNSSPEKKDYKFNVNSNCVPGMFRMCGDLLGHKCTCVEKTIQRVMKRNGSE